MKQYDDWAGISEMLLGKPQRVPLRAEAEKLLEVGAYLDYRMRKMGISMAEPTVFDVPDFGRVTVRAFGFAREIKLEFLEDA